MNTDQTILKGLQEILYGNVRFQLIQEKVHRMGSEILEPFWELSAKPEDYTQNKSALTGLSTSDEKEHIPKKWPRRYYKPVQGMQGDETMIMRFYRTYLMAEVKLMLHGLSKMMEELELTLLAYILIETRDGLIDLLKDLHYPQFTSEQVRTSDDEKTYKQLVYNEIFACLMDMELRFGHLMKDRTVGYDKLFLLKLEQKMPEHPPVFLTPEGAVYYLEKEKITSEALKEITSHLKRHYKALAVCSTDIKREFLKSLKTLENAWIFGELCLNVNVKPFLPDQTFEDADKQIKRVIKQIKANKVNSTILEALYRINEKAEAIHLFLGDDFAVPARKLLGRVAVSENKKASPSEGSQRSSFNPASEYILFDDLVQEMGLNRKTVMGYLKKTDIKVSKLSDKVMLIHQNEVQRFFDMHKETLTDENE